MVISLGVRNAFRRKSRTVIIILAITLSVSLYSGLNVLHTGAVYSVVSAYTDYLGDFDILVTNLKNPFFNEDIASTKLSNISSIDAYAPRLITFGFIPTTGIPLRTVLIGLDQNLDKKIGSFEFLEGKDKNLNNNEAFVSLSLAESLGLSPGANLSVYTVNSTGELIGLNLVVTCVVKQHGKLPVNMREAVFLNLTFLQNALGFKGKVNFLFIKVYGANTGDIQNSIDRIIETSELIQRALGFDFSVVPVKASVMDLVSRQVQSFVAILQVLASLTLLMTVILIFATSNMNLNDRIKEIGILRSIGASKKEIFEMFLTEAITYGVLGGIVGFIFGYLFFGGFLLGLLIPQSLKKYVTIPFNVDSLVFSVSLGLVSSILGSSYTLYRALSVTPSEALTPQARRIKLIEAIKKKLDPSEPFYNMIATGFLVFLISSFLIVFLPIVGFYGDVFLIFSALFLMIILSLLGVVMIFIGFTPKLVDKLRKFRGLRGKLAVIMSSINFLRTKRRGVLGLLMISLSVSAIINLGFTMEAQKIDITNSIKVSQGSPLIVYFNEPAPYNVTKLLENITGIQSFTPITVPISATVGDLILWKTSKVKIYGVNPKGYAGASYLKEFNSINIDEIGSLEENGTVMIPTGLALKLNLGVGSSLRVELPRKTITMKIASIVDIIPGFKFTKFEQKADNLDLVVSINTYENITGTKNILIERIMIKPEKNVDTGEVISKLNEKLGSDYDVQILSTDSLVEENIQSISQFENILSIILYFAIVVAILGHVTLIIASIYERLWEIGILRSMGASQRQILTIYLLEALILAILGYLIGVISAFTMHIENSISNNLTSEIPRPILILPSDVILYTFLAVTVPAISVAYILLRRFTRINIADVLRRS